MEEKQNINTVKKECFIITPIGNDNTSIRRHIEGVIDECITPVLEENYNISVAHRVTTPGSINNQVIEAIYKADLVIANLTELNPNVMYELAFRHSIKKPVIIIMEKGEHKLPFDINNERTIFYDNDFQGAIDLKNRLEEMVCSIENMGTEEISNPIYDALQQIGIRENILKNIDNNKKVNMNEFEYILNRLDNIDKKISLSKFENEIKNADNISYLHEVIIELDEAIIDNREIDKAIDRLKRKLYKYGDSVSPLSFKNRKVSFMTDVNEFMFHNIIRELDNVEGWKKIKYLDLYNNKRVNTVVLNT